MRFFALRGTDELGNAVAAAMGCERDRLEEREFADGEHKSRPLISVRDEDTYVLHTLNGPGGSPAERLMRLLFFIGACRDNGAARVTAVIPYMAFMRKDQQTKARDPVTSRYIAELLESVGTNTVVTVEPHNVSAFQNAFRCRTVQLQMHHAYAERIRSLAAERPIALLSPDSGGIRRVHALEQMLVEAGCTDVRLATMEKHRSGDVVTGDLFAGDVGGTAVFIVDDLIATGTTALRAAEACRDRGAADVCVLATHGLFTTGAQQLLAAPSVDRIIVTDTVARQSLPGGDSTRLETISCAPLIAAAIQRLHSGGSINRLLHPRQ